MIDFLRLRTLPGQLITLFVVVLLVSQVVNVLLIIGERRMQARSTLYASAIEKMANGTEQVIAFPGRRLGPEPRDRRGAPVRIEVNPSSAIGRLSEIECLSAYEEQLSNLLHSRSIQFETVRVCRGEKLRPPERQSGTAGARRSDNGVGRDGQRAMRPPPPGHRPPPDPRGAPGPGFESMVMSVHLADGRWINGITGHYPLENMTPRVFLATGGMVLVTVLVVIFFAGRITRPLTSLAEAADQLGRGGHGISLKEEGPTDLRSAIAAFNAMQERLTRMIETQRTMLRSVGHDLRTPLTSLRIRAEAMEPEVERIKVIATLDEMKAMIEEILTWAEDASGMEELHRVDLNALLTSLSDDYQDAGQNVIYEEGAAIIVLCRRVSLRRALRNLIDNGLKYGDEVNISLFVDGESVRICIDDKGPGIPDEDLRDVLKPFVRLETSRNKDTGGSGLGLSIAQSIIQAHGAELDLQNRKSGGFRASFKLPRET
ncbi:ATP-binding protein [Parvibaculaceae bacterium PLY_AMNH_Bact1]|nr:ATP-binding protein [Parvibaculaceae bacterium PLY_AMNH_Bact1]